MKTRLLFTTIFLLMSVASATAQRYLTEIFTSTTVTSNIVFGQNIQLLTGTPDTIDLRADVYEPVGDTVTARAAVILLHTGSFLPIFYNGQCTGIKTDSTIAEMCRQFARRGYTAIAMDYRLGWNPVATGPAGQEIRTGTLLQAVGRAIQDAKACVRYFRNNANTTNDYSIDQSKFVIGGMGSGGYIALAYATIDSYAEISLTKFKAANNNPTYGFTAGVSYFDSTLWGNIDGYGGTPGYNISTNTPGVSNEVRFAFNCGGAMGDKSWLEDGDVPMVCFHVKSDPFAPYGDGPVIVPTTGDFVVDVSGSYTVIRKADSLENNYPFQFIPWSDPYSVRANQVNEGYDGLFPFELPGPQAGPWEWYDSATVYSTCMFGLGFTQGKTDTIWFNSLATNPDMSSSKGHAYIDTIMGYLNPRIVSTFLVGVEENTLPENLIQIFPNPASDEFHVRVKDLSDPIQFVRIYDLSGRVVYQKENIRAGSVTIRSKDFASGLYTLKAGFEKGVASKILSIE